MIKLIFRKSGRFILSFELDYDGQVKNIVGDDSWFDYLYAPSGVKRIDDPVGWANLLKDSYRGTPVDLFVLEQEKKSKRSLKIIAAIILFSLIIGGVIFFLLKSGSTSNERSRTVVAKSSKSFKSTFAKGKGRFVITIDGEKVNGVFKKGVVVLDKSGKIGKRTWTNQFLFVENAQGETKKPINNFNDFRRSFILMIFSMMPKKINLSNQYASKSLVGDKITVQGKSRSETGILKKGSDYYLRTNSLNFQPESISVSGPANPLGLVVKNIKVDIEYP